MKTHLKTIVARDRIQFKTIVIHYHLIFLWLPLYRPWTSPLRSYHGHVNLKPARIFEQGAPIVFGRN